MLAIDKCLQNRRLGSGFVCPLDLAVLLRKLHAVEVEVSDFPILDVLLSVSLLELLVVFMVFFQYYCHGPLLQFSKQLQWGFYYCSHFLYPYI